jgi:hypothetical protein
MRKSLTPSGLISSSRVSSSPTLERCVDPLDLALAAVRGGADSIELCGPQYGGGIHPAQAWPQRPGQ